MPGELAPKLALGAAAEAARIPAAAVGGTTPSRAPIARTPRRPSGWRAAASRSATGPSALAAYDRIESSSSTYTEAQIARIHCLTAADNGGPASVADLTAADAALRGLQLEGEQRARLTAELIEAALGTLQGVDAAPGAGARVAGHPLVERDLRSGLESNYRDLARMASTTSERIRLVDRANHVRPRTWT